MGGIANLLSSLLNLAGVHLPVWGGAAFLLGMLVVASPWIRINLRTADARKLLKNAARERGAERERMETEALERVGAHPDGLVVVAKEALEQGRKPLAARAVEKLRATRKNLPDLRRLEQALEPPLPGTAAETCIVIEQLLAVGMVEQARGRLARARARWPLDPELAELDSAVAASQSAP